MSDGGRVPLPMEESSCLLLTSAIGHLEQGCAVALLAAQPDPERPTEYLVDVSLVSERPLEEPLSLALVWQGGCRVAQLGRDGSACLQGIPAQAIVALRSGDPDALRLKIEKAESKSDALG